MNNKKKLPPLPLTALEMKESIPVVQTIQGRKHMGSILKVATFFSILRYNYLHVTKDNVLETVQTIFFLILQFLFFQMTTQKYCIK